MLLQTSHAHDRKKDLGVWCSGPDAALSVLVGARTLSTLLGRLRLYYDRANGPRGQRQVWRSRSMNYMRR